MGLPSARLAGRWGHLGDVSEVFSLDCVPVARQIPDSSPVDARGDLGGVLAGQTSLELALTP